MDPPGLLLWCGLMPPPSSCRALGVNEVEFAPPRIWCTQNALVLARLGGGLIKMGPVEFIVFLRLNYSPLVFESGRSEGFVLNSSSLRLYTHDCAPLHAGAGAYCSSMSAKNYNSYPEAPEVLVDNVGELHLIRRKQVRFRTLFSCYQRVHVGDEPLLFYNAPVRIVRHASYDVRAWDMCGYELCGWSAVFFLNAFSLRL